MVRSVQIHRDCEKINQLSHVKSAANMHSSAAITLLLRYHGCFGTYNLTGHSRYEVLGREYMRLFTVLAVNWRIESKVIISGLILRPDNYPKDFSPINILAFCNGQCCLEAEIWPRPVSSQTAIWRTFDCARFISPGHLYFSRFCCLNGSIKKRELNACPGDGNSRLRG